MRRRGAQTIENNRNRAFPDDEEGLVGVSGITTREFVRLLWTQFCERQSGADGQGTEWTAEALADRGRTRGWLEAQDLLEAEKPLLRRSAARILHEFLKRECGETDEADWGSAAQLADLYDCRVCVNHVAQIYAKGIMGARDAKGTLIFGMEERITPYEAGEIVLRTLNSQKREQPDPGEGLQKSAQGILLSVQKAQELLTRRSELRLWDVRTRAEYEREHPQGAENVPLMQILESREDWSTRLPGGVILCCDGGYRSRVAAAFLAQAGCREVYYLGWDMEDPPEANSLRR